MLRKLWRWLVGESDTHLLIQTMLSQHAEVTKAVMEASQKQSEVLGQYLDLFKPKDGEVPTSWKQAENIWNEADLTKMGYPTKASAAEQAEWVLEHIGKFENDGE